MLRRTNRWEIVVNNVEGSLGEARKDFDKLPVFCYTIVMKKYALYELQSLLLQLGMQKDPLENAFSVAQKNMEAHFQGFVKKELLEVENKASTLLRKKTATPAPSAAEKGAYFIHYESKPHSLKPQTVSQWHFLINIPAANLRQQVFSPQESMTTILKKRALQEFEQHISSDIQLQADQLLDEGGKQCSENQLLFERINAFVEYSKELGENPLPKIANLDTIKHEGYDFVAEKLMSILENSAFSVQVIQNDRENHRLSISEYNETQLEKLPDENIRFELFSVSDNDCTSPLYDKLQAGVVLDVFISTINTKRTSIESFRLVLISFLQAITCATNDFFV